MHNDPQEKDPGKKISAPMEGYELAALLRVQGLGNRRLALLRQAFPSAHAIWEASTQALQAVDKITAELAQAIHDFCQKEKDLPLRIQEEVTAVGARVVTPYDEEYPPRLREIYEEPQVLYVMGNLTCLQAPSLAIVGSRHATNYGNAVAKNLAGDLARQGVTIVSGAARGIDSRAHEGALIAKGQTVAVLGCGINVVYPPENRRLLETIQKQGAVISEYPPGTSPNGHYFPARNRIISGLCNGVLVVEAGEKSGALITAEQARRENRDVFAVPGRIYDNMSKGTNWLLHEHAILVRHANDVLQEFGLATEQKVMPTHKTSGEANAEAEPEALPPGLSSAEATVYQLLSRETPLSVDDIIRKGRGTVSEINFLLCNLEIQGIIKKTPDSMYLRL